MHNAVEILEAALQKYGAVTIQLTRRGVCLTFWTGQDPANADLHAPTVTLSVERLGYDVGIVPEPGPSLRR